VRVSRGVGLLIYLVLAVSLSMAQSPNGTMSGIVLDPAGGVIVGADVVIINNATGVQYPGKANSEGYYVVPNIPPGTYRVQVSNRGFKTIIKPDIVIHVEDALAINFTLPIGAASELVTVEGGAPLINTTDASVGTVVDSKFVENIPLNGRSFQDLISMTPGVVTQSPNASPTGAGSGGDFSVNGQRTESNYYMVDGVAGNVSAGTGFGTQNSTQTQATSGSVPAGTVLGTTQSLISVDALQEFRVLSSTYSAEFGRTPGGQFSLVTRSGTNDFHGTAFDYLRNGVFDASDWFNNALGVANSPLRQNDFGGTLGGPVRIPHLYDGKDKTFFFVSYEGLRLAQPQPAAANQYVPDTYLREQAPAALQSILNAYPVQNGKDFGTPAAPSVAQFIGAYSVPSQIDSISVRLDHTFSPKLSLFFRFGDTPSSQASRGTLGGLSALSQTNFDTQTFTLGAVSQLSSRASNDFRLGYVRSDAKQAATLDGFGGATPTDLATAMGVGSYVNAFPAIDLFFPGIGISALRDSGGSSNRLRQWNLIDSFSIVSGHHQFKFGVDFRRIASPGNPASPAVTGVYFGPESILTNQASDLFIQKYLSATPIFNETAAFVQDEWRVTSRLNLSLGLRWEVDPPPHGANGNDAYTVFGSIDDPASLTLAPKGTPLWHTTWYNFAPRMGFAWIARNTPGRETVVRAGGGVFFDTNNQVASAGFSAVGSAATMFYFGVPLPATPAQLNFAPSASAPYDLVSAFPSHLQQPYTLQWNVSVQQAMGRSQAFTLSYVGAEGRRLTGQENLSPGALNPNFGTIYYWRANLTSNYQALQALFQRSVTRGVHALASYTWSHCLDFGSNYYTLPYNRGNCDVDVRQNFQAGASWDLPSLRGNKFAEALLNHWGLDTRLIARTSFPVTLCGSYVTDPATGSLYCAGLSVVPNEPIYLHGSQYPGNRAINSNAFCDSILGPCAGGAAARNFVRGFGETQINLAVRREFPIKERLRLQFRAEAFNILNHPNFGFVDPNLGDATFGQATKMLNQGLGTVAAQYQQGGPRSMQFALKLLF
jgi:hypothetical protein